MAVGATTGKASVLGRRLIVVTGKGGVGKTTTAAALALAAAEGGRRTLVVELGDQRRLPELFGGASRDGGACPDEEVKLADNMWCMTIDPDRALLEWLQKLGGRVPGRVLAKSGTFQYFAAAAPGARELVSMVKIWNLTGGDNGRGRRKGYDLVVLDGPATGHAIGLLHSPRTFAAIARVGPVFGQAEQVRELLEDESRTGYLAVTLATDMAVGETLDLQESLRSRLGCRLDAAIVNATLPRRFDGHELARIARLDGAGTVQRSAFLAARAIHERARIQHNQIARLRRSGLSVHQVPFVFAPSLDLDAVRAIGRRLAGRV